MACAGHKVEYGGIKTGDFRIDNDIVIEAGGASKGMAQISDEDKGKAAPLIWQPATEFRFGLLDSYTDYCYLHTGINYKDMLQIGENYFVRILTITATLLGICGCALMVHKINAPTYMEVDGVSYSSSIEEVSYNYYNMGHISIEKDSSFLFTYDRTMHCDAGEIELKLRLRSDEVFKMRKRYALREDEVRNMTLVYLDNETYYATEGWIIFNDIVTGLDSYLWGAFEFTAKTEDKTKTISVTDGTFERVPCSMHRYK